MNIKSIVIMLMPNMSVWMNFGYVDKLGLHEVDVHEWLKQISGLIKFK